MNSVLNRLISHIIKRGNLTITAADGTVRTYGDGSGAPVSLVVHTPAAERAIALDPTLALPEAYMEGEVSFREGDVLALLQLVYTNTEGMGIDTFWARAIETMRGAFRRLQQMNTLARSKRNVAHHYDLSGELYRMFLDEDMQYSCAYFPSVETTLEEAQRAKKRHIMAKLQLEKGQSVLDIGCGWGGLALDMAQMFDLDVLGVTLSEEQLSVATRRAHDRHLENHVHFELRDYRNLTERFDRIVSVGMFEHVGLNHYPTFFNNCHRLLKPDGVMLLHTIGRSGVPYATNAFIRKHIFPGGYIPALSEMLPAIERSGLIVTDVEILRMHYAETLKEWRARFRAHWDVAARIYDERFCRMWDFYLAGSEAAFRWQDMVVFQVQLARRNDSLPVTRDYMLRDEQALREAVRTEQIA
ncbi:SAM-dependent methyltransferase [Limoniibacter endophyticus]|uniref:Cyclopropane-fatty-acyl-phospholipid synthase n=1 Tax=Limoniibacter endophyticus TaxID=1565040 RepID=A0A8J3DGS9_9HYPH|nr:cyclopropane-fatty-acyl-phospholipid synthase family protein [Limoniibacter endophyticus]GHC68851.1 cyclopropane-fatty-acyl-phospholipid synthase [Limoniibacter endophyticus]